MTDLARSRSKTRRPPTPHADDELERRRARTPARAAPPRADRLLLPDARLRRSRPRTPCRRRWCGPGSAYDRFEGRSSLRSWLYRIATNVCLDMLGGKQRRARPMDMIASRQVGPTQPGADAAARRRGSSRCPTGRVVPDGGDPGEVAVAQRVGPPGVHRRAAAPAAAAARRADPARGAALEGRRGRRAARHDRRLGEQRAAAGPGHDRGQQPRRWPTASRRSTTTRSRCCRATSTRSSATTWRRSRRCSTRTPRSRCRRTTLWLQGRDDVFAWWVGPGRVVPRVAARRRPRPTAQPAFGQYKPTGDGGYAPWALQVLEIEDGQVTGMIFFLDTERTVPAVRPPAAPGLTPDASAAPAVRARPGAGRPRTRLHRADGSIPPGPHRQGRRHHRRQPGHRQGHRLRLRRARRRRRHRQPQARQLPGRGRRDRREDRAAGRSPSAPTSGGGTSATPSPTRCWRRSGAATSSSTTPACRRSTRRSPTSPRSTTTRCRR